MLLTKGNAQKVTERGTTYLIKSGTSSVASDPGLVGCLNVLGQFLYSLAISDGIG